MYKNASHEDCQASSLWKCAQNSINKSTAMKENQNILLQESQVVKEFRGFCASEKP